MHQQPGRRIIVVGSSNAGKTTVASHLAELLDAPFTDLDALHWEPGWVEADLAVFRKRVQQAIASESWVLAGNYLARQQEISWARADTIVWLDHPIATVLRRCARRTWQRYRTQEVLYGGENRENFWEHLMLWNADKSLFAHIVRTHRRHRRELDAMMGDPRWKRLTFIRLRSEGEVDRWLNVVEDREQSNAGLEVPLRNGRHSNIGSMVDATIPGRDRIQQ